MFDTIVCKKKNKLHFRMIYSYIFYKVWRYCLREKTTHTCFSFFSFVRSFGTRRVKRWLLIPSFHLLVVDDVRSGEMLSLHYVRKVNCSPSKFFDSFFRLMRPTDRPTWLTGNGRFWPYWTHTCIHPQLIVYPFPFFFYTWWREMKKQGRRFSSPFFLNICWMYIHTLYKQLL